LSFIVTRRLCVMAPCTFWCTHFSSTSPDIRSEAASRKAGFLMGWSITTHKNC
jgi:hypothetical protein